MWGSTIPCVYYGFYCNATRQKIYWSMVSILAGGCIFATLTPSFQGPKFRVFRTIMYSSLGLSFVIPITDSIIVYGWETQLKRMSLDWMLAMATFNLTGAAAYALRVCKPCEKSPPIVYCSARSKSSLTLIAG